MRLLDLLKKAADTLEAAGIDDALADAEMLVFHGLKIDRLSAYVDNPLLKSGEAARLQGWLKRRAAGEPVQYIIGHIEFFGLTIRVGRGVLIPRPETELLVQEVLDTVRSGRAESRDILDLCTGSGCIALSLARSFPEALVTGTDLSQEALTYARKNRAANSIPNIRFRRGPLFEPVKGRQFDIITANPPYIRQEEIGTLQPEVRDWEPVMALDGGRDGMDFYRAIFRQAGGFLRPGGWIFCELGYDQSGAAADIAKAAGFRGVEVINDYAGIGRILKAAI